jgi:hypothetical protein
MTFNITTFSTMTIYAYAECLYAESFMLSVTNNTILLNVLLEAKQSNPR